MELDQVISVKLTYQMRGEPIQSRSIAASEFFDLDYFNLYGVESATCLSPWSKDDLRDYVEVPKAEERRALQWVQLDIVQERTLECRRVIQREWGEHWVSASWIRKPGSEPKCEVILQIGEHGGSAWHILKLGLPPMELSLLGHALFRGGSSLEPESIDPFDLQSGALKAPEY